MNPVQSVRGKIADPNGQAVTNAFVTLGFGNYIFPGRQTPETRSDADGRFTFARVQAGMKTLGVKADGFAPLVKTVEVRRGLSEIEVQLERGSPLKIRVVDEQKNPIPNASFRVSVFSTDGGDIGPFWHYPSWEWQADQEGRFIWSNSPPQTIAWSISKPGFMGLDRFPLKPSDQEQRLLCSLRSVSAAKLLIRKPKILCRNS